MSDTGEIKALESNTDEQEKKIIYIYIYIGIFKVIEANGVSRN